MSYLFSNWLKEGYYEDDGFGYTKVDDPIRIRELQNSGNLYEHDGVSLNKVDDINDKLSEFFNNNIRDEH